MGIDWGSAAPSVIAAFFASLVEFIEALTIVLAVGAVRGWRSALGGAGLALAVLVTLVAVFGSALTRIPLGVMQLGLGALLLLFGVRWLRKAILRAAGVMALKDQAATYARESAALAAQGGGGGWDRIAVAAAFKVTMIEGIEVVFIVIAVGTAGHGLLLPASVGALAALALVILLGVALHRPVAMIPENTLKFIVGVLLCTFGIFWAGEGAGLAWPGGDWSIPALSAGILAAAMVAIPACRAASASPDRASRDW
jgi:uncharacterized membrane protein